MILSVHSSGSGLVDLFNIGGSSSTDAEVVVNNEGIDCDFRVESDASSHAFFVQASDGKIGIGTTDPQVNMHLVDDNPDIRVESLGTTGYGSLSFYNKDIHNGMLNNFNFYALNSASVYHQFGSIDVERQFSTDTEEQAVIKFKPYVAGTARNILEVGGAVGGSGSGEVEVVVNEDGIDCNFRVESDASSNAFFVQGSGDGYVGIGTINPSSRLTVNGFTTLGLDTTSVAIKMKKVAFTLGNSGGDNFAHGVATHTKILAVNILVNVSGALIPPSYEDIATYRLDYTIGATNVTIIYEVGLNEKSGTMLITYEE
jgi:hypothetical protein